MDMMNARISHKSDTTEHWNAVRTFIPLRGEIIIYTDHGQIDDGFGNMINVPGIKIGDGNAYLIDLPFVGNETRYDILAQLKAHADDDDIHVSVLEKQFWNDKLNYEVNGEVLTFNRN